jgi:type IV pilus assembly protein PilE
MEVLITVAIVGILAAIALPAYKNQIQKSRRSDAKSALVGAAGQMERYFTERGTYATATLGSGGIYPSTTQNGYYTLSFAGHTATTYTLRATPAGAQVGDPCGNLTYDYLGNKGRTGTLPMDQCW